MRNTDLFSFTCTRPDSHMQLSLSLSRSTPYGNQRAALSFSCSFVKKKKKKVLYKLLEPLEALGKAHFPDDGAHEDLDRSDVLESSGSALAGGEVHQPKRMTELILGRSTRHVDLVAEDQERDVRELLVRKKIIQLVLDFVESLAVVRVHQKDHRVDRRVIVGPDTARGLVPAEIERAEPDLPDHHLLRGRLLRGDVRRHLVIPQHVHQRRLPCIVQPQKQNLRVLVPQPQRRQYIPEPAKHPEPRQPAPSTTTASSSSFS
mmetsp:Transcript_13169/g.28603  ORF Transcript_13169/g.28603 Transcript_13169/m.28603 type:complete len:261 (-) Transcript_13169:14-796(-)